MEDGEEVDDGFQVPIKSARRLTLSKNTWEAMPLSGRHGEALELICLDGTRQHRYRRYYRRHRCGAAAAAATDVELWQSGVNLATGVTHVSLLPAEHFT